MNFNALINDFGELTSTGLAQGAIYALFALGYTLVYGVLRLINFAHSEVFMAGTFASVLTWRALGLDQNSPVPPAVQLVGYLLVGLVVAMLASAATALFVERVAYRPLRRRNAPILAFLITAIGTSVVLSELVGILTRRRVQGTPTLLRSSTVVEIGGARITTLQIGLLVTAIVMMVGLDFFVNRTRLGRGIRAVAQSPDTAALMGVNKDRVIALVFLLGGLMAGVAALMYNLKIGNPKYNVGFDLGIKAFAAAVLGGIGNIRGAMLGGLLLGVVENYGAALFGSNYINAVAFVVLVLVLLFRPTGMLGESLGRTRA
ncbi:MAG: branched-chain amino acid ABC transporter permease [Micromonosporaceae bacterium]